MDVETVEEVAPGVALVTDYELIGVPSPSRGAALSSPSPWPWG